jgi:hypothetical protein
VTRMLVYARAALRFEKLLGALVYGLWSIKANTQAICQVVVLHVALQV